MQQNLILNLDYIESNTKKVKEMCMDMSQVLSVQEFIYKKIYSDSRHLMLCSCSKKYIYQYLKLVENNVYGKFLNQIVKQTTTNQFSYFIYPEKSNYDCVINLNHKESLSKYAICLCYRYNNEFVETFSFFIDIKGINFFNFIINHLELFKQFSLFFLQMSHEIVGKENEKCLIIPQVKKEIKFNEVINKKENIFLEQIMNNKFSFLKDTDNKTVRLTPKEIEIAKELIKGSYTVKEIANKLGISGRTTEHHVTHLKYKFNCDTKVNLIHHLQNQNLFYRLCGN